MAPSLVTWPTRIIATPDGLGGHGQRRGDRTHLGDAAGDAVGLGGGHGLHRVDDHQAGLHLVDVAQRHLQIGFGGQVDLVVRAAGAFGAHPDLARRLLTRQIQRALAGLRPAVRDLQQQRRLADAGIAREQRHRPGDQPAAQHPVQFADAGVEVAGVAGIDRADRHRGRGRGDRAPHRASRSPRRAPRLRRPCPRCRSPDSGPPIWR